MDCCSSPSTKVTRFAMPKELEKAEVGRLWAARSGETALFAMLYKNEGGKNVSQQLNEALSRPAG